MSYSTAAYNPIFLFNIEKLSFLKFETGGIPLGVYNKYQFELKKYKLKNVIGFIYSNGLLCTANDKGYTFSVDIIKKIIVKHHESSPKEIVRKIYSYYKNFERFSQLHDATLILFKISI